MDLKKTTNTEKYIFLDGVRGLAAVYVMVGHARWLLWEGFVDGYNLHPADYSIIDKVLMYFFLFFRYGHEVVLLFFVLSGFVIHINFANKLKENPQLYINFGQYFFKRIKRIYPPFLLALFVTMVLDMMGKAYHFQIYSGNTSYSSINENFKSVNNDASTLIGNMLFLYKEYFPLFGTNGPTWSLKLEWWFYLIYPLLLIISRKNIYYSTSIIILLFIFSFFPGLWPESLLRYVFSSMICWWLGTLLAEVISGRLQIKLLYFSLISFIGFCILLFVSSTSTLYDLRIAFLFSSILSLLLWLNKRGVELRYLKVFKPVGDFSYSLYIIHFPIIVFFSGVIMRFNQNKLPKHSFYVLAGILICLIISYLVHLFVEVPFINSKKVRANLNLLIKQS